MSDNDFEANNNSRLDSVKANDISATISTSRHRKNKDLLRFTNVIYLLKDYFLRRDSTLSRAQLDCKYERDISVQRQLEHSMILIIGSY